MEKECPFDFSRHSSIGCGGFAKVAYFPRTENELIEGLAQCKAEGEEFIVVGNMTNVLPSDLGTKKRVFCTKKLVKVCVDEENDSVYAEAGVMSGALLKACKKAGESGVEFLIGIPCTVGGALYMNAGAGGTYVSEIVKSVRVYRAGEVITLSNNDCKYAYKSSIFMEREDVIIGGTFELEKKDEREISAMEKRWLQKRAHLPKGKSMGCVFKNPLNYSAGELIDRTGLKGLRIGGAKISEEHANFIINDGKATARQIETLIGIIKNAVFAQYGIVLQEEIRYIT